MLGMGAPTYEQVLDRSFWPGNIWHTPNPPPVFSDVGARTPSPAPKKAILPLFRGWGSFLHGSVSTTGCAEIPCA